MGTRADFYVGRGKQAEWLGSIAWDGYPKGIEPEIGNAVEEKRYRDLVTQYVAERRDGTKPADGWPWPWDDSGTTDFAYSFDDGMVWVSCFGSPWVEFSKWDSEEDREEASGKVDFPDMKDKKNVTMGPRSGLIVFGA